MSLQLHFASGSAVTLPTIRSSQALWPRVRRYLVTNDRDLLDLGNPFGIRVVTPVEFLRILRDRFALD